MSGQPLQLGTICLFAMAITWVAQPLQGQNFTPDPTDSEARFVEYERKLNAILKTRFDAEKKFVADVVDQVELEKIPSKLVSTSFDWVRKKRPTTNYPFVYFERVLRLQAERIGLEDEIPPFDYNTYRSISQQDPGEDKREKTSAGQTTLSRIREFFSAGTRRLFNR